MFNFSTTNPDRGSFRVIFNPRSKEYVINIQWIAEILAAELCQPVIVIVVVEENRSNSRGWYFNNENSNMTRPCQIYAYYIIYTYNCSCVLPSHAYIIYIYSPWGGIWFSKVPFFCPPVTSTFHAHIQWLRLRRYIWQKDIAEIVCVEGEGFKGEQTK